jgi:hypothetical protein
LLDIIMPMSCGRTCSTDCSAVVDVTALLVDVVSMDVVVVSIVVVVVVVLLLVVVCFTKG